MTAKKAHTDTMNLLVVPFGFCTGTELLNTRPHNSHMALPMVNDGPCGSERAKQRENNENIGKRCCRLGYKWKVKVNKCVLFDLF